MVTSAKRIAAEALLRNPVTAHRVERDGAVVHHGVSINVQDMDHRTAAAIALGMYEKDETRFIREHLRCSVNVVELGASAGVTGAHLLDVMHQGGRYVGVEANPALIPGLERMLVPRGRSVTIVHAAITDRAEAFLEVRANATSSRLRDEGTPVPATTLERLADDHGLDRFVLVSDIEGAEAGFILGDDPGLDRVDRMVIELHGTSHRGAEVSAADLADAVERRGFRRIDGRGRVHVFDRHCSKP